MATNITLINFELIQRTLENSYALFTWLNIIQCSPNPDARRAALIPILSFIRNLRIRNT